MSCSYTNEKEQAGEIMDERQRNKKINELLLKINGDPEKEEVAGYVARAMRECGYSNENIHQVIKHVYRQFEQIKT
ncbi:hypothetical protein M1K46_07035 [Fictibacillus sp. WQ 8-8]|uniref:hypothetical protein n=2 Tax=Fictibacillus TaxID=1329200 RepID=UPI00210D0BF2|nr:MULTISPECIES: hypothetical protein [unclassified Fictibacillus]MCQ6265415.1 hypothetical protein [Fictibacillus sp. WQ 8-8]MED2973684.1 hypothetical protein [Fictibacillus sp. B-59209]